MKPGKAFEIFVKRLLMCVGFSEVRSDGLYIYDAAPGQMIQGLGEIVLEFWNDLHDYLTSNYDFER